MEKSLYTPTRRPWGSKGFSHVPLSSKVQPVPSFISPGVGSLRVRSGTLLVKSRLLLSSYGVSWTGVSMDL